MAAKFHSAAMFIALTVNGKGNAINKEILEKSVIKRYSIECVQN